MIFVPRFTFIFLLLLAVNANSYELAGSNQNSPPQVASSNEVNQCTPEAKQKNIDILTECNSSWEAWGITPKPGSEELRDPNNCSSLASLGTLEGCADALVAFPIFIGEMALRGMLATIPADKSSFAYVSQNGSLQEIKSYLSNEFLREKCSVGPNDFNTYVDQKCPTDVTQTNPHTNPQGAQTCRQEALKKVQSARSCIRLPETRNTYRSQASRLNTQALDIKRRQDERKAREVQFQRDIQSIKSSCDHNLNQLRGSMTAYLMPIQFLVAETRNALLPNKSKVQEFNDCVERQTRGKKELREALLKNSTGIIEQISGSFQSIKCYKERDRKALQCEIAMGVLTGGAGLSAFAVKKLGRASVKQYSRRVASRNNTISASETTSFAKESANDSLLQIAKDHPGEVITSNGVTPSGKTWKAVHSYEKQSGLPRKTRNFFKKLRRLSSPGNARNREYAGYIVEYEDGSTAAIQFTSNKYARIDTEDWVKARDYSDVENRGGRVKKVIHIHTHPWDKNYSSMTPSDGDIGAYENIIKANDDFDKYMGFSGDVEFESYILPVCDGCEDVIIRMNKEQVQQSRQ